MRIDKNLVVIGLSDDDTAHLRLLMRKAADQLQQRWRWGTEEAADLVIVDTESFAGQMARTRSIAAGLRCAVVTDDPAASDQELRLHRPLKLPNVVDVLNRAGGGLVLLPQIDGGHDDLYLEFTATPSRKLDPPDSARAVLQESGTDHAASSDALFKREDTGGKQRYSVPLTLDEKTEIEGVTGHSRRSDYHVTDNEALLGSGSPGPNTLPQIRRGGSVDNGRENAKHPLRAYLEQALLAGPAQLKLDNAPISLALDPKNGVFHTDGNLAQLELYVREPIWRSDWRTLTTGEINQLRENQPAQPYQNLIWLEALVTSGGRLAPQLDPGGTYRLKHWLELDRDVRQHQRIARAMMQPARLNEIAANANVPMADVFDVVNAYHAIGMVEWESRASLRAQKSDQGGLLSRLKRPFGKS